MELCDGRRRDSIRNWDCVPFRSMPHIGEIACSEMKMIGKPYAGERTYGLMRGNRTSFHGRA